MKFIIVLCTLVAAQLMSAQSALAWGPAVHVVTALSSLEGAGLILPSIAGIITSFPIEYLYGSLAADFFIGKSKGKMGGHLHNWEGGFKLLTGADDDRAAAYAYGFLSHLAADVVAHNFFIPNLINAYPTGRRLGHLYWEIKADHLVGPGYMKIAQDVLSMDHRGCDELLNLITRKRGNGLKAKKLLFTQSVKFSDYLYTTQHMFFPEKGFRSKFFYQYLGFMIDLSCRLVRDLLEHPESSRCLLYDPLGKRNLRLVKRKWLFPGLSNTPHPMQRFPVDQELFEL